MKNSINKNALSRNICSYCDEPIPFGHVQQGDMHYGCYNEEINVYKITLDKTEENHFYEEELPDLNELFKNEDLIIVRKIKMPRGYFYSLPD